METNTAEEKKCRVSLKPLNPRLTPEDRLDADLRFLSRALHAWECKCDRAIVTTDRRLLIAACGTAALSPVRSKTGRGELGPNRESPLPRVSPEE